MNRRMEAYAHSLDACHHVEAITCAYGSATAKVIKRRIVGDDEGKAAAKKTLRRLRRELEIAVAESHRLFLISKTIEDELDAKSEKRRLAKAAKTANGR